ncbi:MAG: hypothetical protein LBB88_01685 [Planctomycetaceae bacterium]|jgi:hypothetical protein|nr:hypothetical protein [Planctomycetaceae bacterium]
MTFQFIIRFSIYLLFIFFIYGFVSADGDNNLLLNETFEKDLHGWQAERSARIYTHENMLRIDTLKDNTADSDPIISKSYNLVGSQIRLIIEVKTLTASEMIINWTTKESPTRDNRKKFVQKLNPDGDWHKIGFFLPVEDMLETISIRFTNSSGTWTIRSIALYGRQTNPIALQKISSFHQRFPDGTERDVLRYTVRNNAPFAIKFIVEQPEGVEEKPTTLSRNQTIDFGAPIKYVGNLAAVKLSLRSNDPAVAEWFPKTVFPAFLYDPKPTTNWITSNLGQFIFEISPDARIARIRQNNEVVAIIAPIVHQNGIIPDFKQKKEPQIINAANIINVTNNQNRNSNDSNSNSNSVSNTNFNSNSDSNSNRVTIAAGDISTDKMPFSFSSSVADLDILIVNDTIKFSIRSKPDTDEKSDIEPFEGPVIRLFGKLKSGLLPGVEFIETGDVSSSAVDINPPYNYRGKPNPSWITMQMASLGTDKIAAMLSWKNTELQPTFHSPNTIDYTEDHRISLVGKSIDAELRLFPAVDLKSGESAAVRSLRNYVKENGLPKPSASPRNSAEQFKLSLAGIHGAVQSPDGAAWGYATDPAWQRRPYADMFSTIARLTSRTPLIKEIESGGADIANDAIYFLTENVEQWKSARENSIKSIIALKNPDGSYLFRTRFPEVENAATSHGLTAIRTLEVMEYVRFTGNKRLFEMVKESLEYLIKCEIPRGGFYQDSPLHTPDLLSAATLTWLFVWAYEYSGDQRYLDAANRFAICGLSFVYQWTNRETMLYVTIPKLGGSSRGIPVWFGVSQPRAGIVYAYALTLLAEYDKSIDWMQVATGILYSAEKMQFTSGENVGCLPDIFTIESQHSGLVGINPVAVTILRLSIERRPSTLFVLVDHGDRYVSPFPLRSSKRGIEAFDVPTDQSFQVLCNGSRIINAKGNGLISLD